MRFRTSLPRGVSSIRSRMIAALVIIPMLALFVFVGTSLRSVVNMVSKQIEDRFDVIFTGAADALRDTLDRMCAISNDLTYFGNATASMLESGFYMDEQTRASLYVNVRRVLVNYEFNNKAIAQIGYVDMDAQRTIIATETEDDRVIFGAEALASYFNCVVHAPHQPANTLNGSKPVLSILKPFPSQYGQHALAVYIETTPGYLVSLLQDSVSPDEPVVLAVADADGRTLATTDESVAALGVSVSADGAYRVSRYDAGAFTLTALVDAQYYDGVYLSLMWQYIIGLAAFLLLFVILFVFMWRTVYLPVRTFAEELSQGNSELYRPHSMRVREFDAFRAELDKIRTQIKLLVTQAELDERKRAELEMELLRSRINPHFLHNTLDNIRWIALSETPGDVAGLLKALNNLTYYNLGKRKQTTLQEEIQAVDDYMLLQGRMRSFVYRKDIQADEAALASVVPCFILQPLMENALQHGYRQGMEVTLLVRSDGDAVEAIVTDNGEGMSADKLAELRARVTENVYDSRSIGLTYIMRSMRLMYGDRADIDIQSSPGEGTSVGLRFRARRALC